MQRGWERNTLLSLYFGPSPASLVDPHPSFDSLTNKVPPRTCLTFPTNVTPPVHTPTRIHPLTSKWLVAPVTDSLIYRSERVKPELKRWVNDVAEVGESHSYP